MIMTIKQFISEVNSVFPTSDQIIHKYKKVIPDFNETKAEVYRQNNLLKISNENSEDIPIIDQLIYHTNVSTIGIGSINFPREILLLDDSLCEFASYNDFFKFCYRIIDKTVISFNESYDNQEIVAANPEQFLSFLLEYDKYWKALIFGTNYSKEESREVLHGLIQSGFSIRWVDELVPGWSGN